MADSKDWVGTKETKNDNSWFRRDPWHKYAKGCDEIKSNGMLIKLLRLANFNISFNINVLSALIIYKL